MESNNSTSKLSLYIIAVDKIAALGYSDQIEVLWSKGEKPLPPLHPLLIKGRNLYRLKTLRQVCAK